MDLLERDGVIVIEDDVIVIDDEEGTGLQIKYLSSSTSSKPPTVTLVPQRLPSCVSILTLSDDEQPHIMPRLPIVESHSIEPRFRTPNYGPRGSCPTNRASCARSPRSQRRIDSLPTQRTSPFASSCTSQSASNDPGTRADPIELDSENDDYPPISSVRHSIKVDDRRHGLNIGTHKELSIDESGTLNPNNVLEHPLQVEEAEQSTLQRNLAENVQRMDVIDLDELEDDQEDELRILAVQNIRPEEDQLQTQPRAARVVKVQQRNPSIVQPWSKCPGYQHENLLLKPNKTVELIDGDFLRIRDIVYNAQTQEVRVCGNRFQRTRDLNGLLERKMNELVLFLEVDLDDPRPHLEQSAVQIPLIEIKKIRSLRLTNQKFPLDRNLQPKDFRTRHDITHEGGLTCRWKYTCTYSTGADRYQNVHKERRLERIRADECTGANVLSDADRRSQWREETIPGGAYKPSLMIDAARSPSIIDEGFLDSVGSSSNQEDHNVEVIATHTSTARVGRNREMSVSEVFWPIKTEKRKHSDTETMSLSIQERTKRPRFDGEAVVEETRRRLSIYTLGNNIEEPDILLSRRKVSEVVISSQTIDFSRDPKSSISEPINLMSSDLSTPPPSGSIHTSALIPVEPVHRLPGQKLTYSDAFCGGGGSTRGAVMAGFQVKWGFDFNKHACETWKANFPNANCYHESSHDFVSRVQHSPRKERFKVDILHLSPPCQFFSPAHTVDGQDDEMNVASLFAVQSVIEAARPRVVTLEQTFGIVNERFRWFFNALIQMFTSHEFSVRWAVIPLQRWGLPQHRRRLIIIASCPGEVLPRMPDATHGENPSLGDTLKPYVSVDSVLASIPANAPDHDRLAVRFAEDKRMAPWDGSKILPRAMTTSGGQNYHPKGFRDFTLREYACLQGFPVCHLFKGNYVKKQIGNAVPPVVAKVLFESVKRDLDIADGIVEGVEVLD